MPGPGAVRALWCGQQAVPESYDAWGLLHEGALPASEGKRTLGGMELAVRADAVSGGARCPSRLPWNIRLHDESEYLSRTIPIDASSLARHP